ncbi:MAG: hypothetical protein OXG24_06390 [Gammaproteobacteria bacterium]|nr:hypothetical protein [Gammaproteobacteria bacterium]
MGRRLAEDMLCNDAVHVSTLIAVDHEKPRLTSSTLLPALSTRKVFYPFRRAIGAFGLDVFVM